MPISSTTDGLSTGRSALQLALGWFQSVNPVSAYQLHNRWLINWEVSSPTRSGLELVSECEPSQCLSISSTTDGLSTGRSALQLALGWSWFQSVNPVSAYQLHNRWLINWEVSSPTRSGLELVSECEPCQCLSAPQPMAYQLGGQLSNSLWAGAGFRV